MSNKRRDDAAWLLARERGKPGPSISRADVERYEQLEALIAGLPDTPVAPPTGWQQRMLAKLDGAAAGAADGDAGATAPTARPELPRKPRRWAIAGAAVSMVAALAIVLVLIRRGPDPAPEDPLIAATVEPGPLHRRGERSVGDKLIVRALPGSRGGELRVYDDAGIERARCAAPGPGCHIERSGDRAWLVLTMDVERAGALHPVLFSPPLGRPSAGLVADVSAAIEADLEISRLEAMTFR